MTGEGEGDQVASIAAFTMVDEPPARPAAAAPAPTNGHAPTPNGAAGDADALLNETIPLELDEDEDQE